ncbi:MAG: hypothetical protein Q8S05_02260, partial [Sulfuricella sp.]|nr:hypothetical protein [Sulfuricella sp.]
MATFAGGEGNIWWGLGDWVSWGASPVIGGVFLPETLYLPRCSGLLWTSLEVFLVDRMRIELTT